MAFSLLEFNFFCAIFSIFPFIGIIFISLVEASGGVDLFLKAAKKRKKKKKIKKIFEANGQSAFKNCCETSELFSFATTVCCWM